MLLIATLPIFLQVVVLAECIIRIKPRGNHQIFQSNSTFTLTCQSTNRIKWQLPILQNFSKSYFNDLPSRKTINYSQKPADEFKYQAELSVMNANYLDTGYYTCRREGAPETDTDDNRIAVKTYVFIQDDNHLIVHPDVSEMEIIDVIQSSRAIIPCKPTHPDIEVFLTSDRVTLDQWRYDNRQGFVQMNPSILHDHAVYECRAVKDERNQIQNYLLQVFPDTNAAPKPFIDVTNIHVTLSETFRLNCSAYYDHGTMMHLKWTIPSTTGIKEGRISVTNSSPITLINNGISIRSTYVILTVTNAKLEDTGTYQCTSTDHTNKQDSATSKVTVQEKDAAFINLKSVPMHQASQNPKVQDWFRIVVDFEAFPKPETNWFGPSGALIQSSDKFNITDKKGESDYMAILNINNLTITDAGKYSLKININSALIQWSNTTLSVIAPPFITAVSREQIIRLQQTFSLEWNAFVYEHTHFTLDFLECPPAMNMCGANWITLYSNSTCESIRTGAERLISVNNEKIQCKIVDVQTNRKIIVKGHGKIAGQYRLSACNHLGCNSDQNATIEMLKVTDMNETNDVQLYSDVDMQQIIEGDQLKLTCAISLYEFLPRITWFYANNSTNEQKVTISNHKFNNTWTYANSANIVGDDSSLYSYMETLQFVKINKTMNGYYSCWAPHIKGKNLGTGKFVQVQDQMAPVIFSTNEVKRMQQGQKGELFCEGYALPLPVITWTKDGAALKSEPIIRGNRSSLQMVFSKEDSGYYECQFENRVNKTSRKFYMHVSADEQLGTIWAIIIVVIIAIVLLVILIRKVQQDKKRTEFFRTNQLDMFDKGNPGSINPDLPVDEQTELLPYDRRWEFPRDQLKLGKQLGAGAFGRVVKAQAFGIDSEPVTSVAVKMVRSHADIALKALMSELKIMIHLGSHLNVVNLLGACTKNLARGELLVIVEYCRYGNVQNYLMRNRDSFLNQLDANGNIEPGLADQGQGYIQGSPVLRDELDISSDPGNRTMDNGVISMAPTGGTILSDMSEMEGQENSSGGQNHQPWRSNYRGDYLNIATISTRDLICWSFQIARGMGYLANRKVLHGDLAARNILLADDNIVKIADFGLAKEVYRSGNYKKKGEGPLPVKWMAIESITDRIFSTQSDVWAFGIVLWELFSLGKTPYPGMEPDENFFRKLQEGYRMDKPKFAPNQIDLMMQHCWKAEPQKRPDFNQLEQLLSKLLDESVRHHYMVLNDAYMLVNEMKTTTSPDYLSMMSSTNYENIRSSVHINHYMNVNNIVTTTPQTQQCDYLAMTEMNNSRDRLAAPEYLFMNSSISSLASGDNPQQTNDHLLQRERTVQQSNDDCINVNRPENKETAFSNPHYQL